MILENVRLEDPDFYFEGRRESYQRLHAEDPVHYYEPLDLFVLTKHEDIREAARRPEIFSSSRGLHLHQLRLTPAEVAVLRLIAAGNANKEIAARLSVTEETVKGRVKNILSKLGANDRTHAAMIGIRRGIIEP